MNSHLFRVDIQSLLLHLREQDRLLMALLHMLKEIGQLARADIERLLGCQVYLELWVKVRKDWRDSLEALRSFGYDE